MAAGVCCSCRRGAGALYRRVESPDASVGCGHARYGRRPLLLRQSISAACHDSRRADPLSAHTRRTDRSSWACAPTFAMSWCARARCRARSSDEFPAPSLWPLLTAIATTGLFIGSIFTPWAVGMGGDPGVHHDGRLVLAQASRTRGGSPTVADAGANAAAAERSSGSRGRRYEGRRSLFGSLF